MKYDFDRLYSRQNTGSVKWDLTEKLFGSSDVIPMWVADMDFPAARPVTDALRKRIEHEYYGYTCAGPELTEAVVDRVRRKFGWQIEPEWVVYTPGVISALHMAVRSLTRPGDAVVLQEPVYYPFFPVVKENGCQVATNELKLSRGRYHMDFDDLRSKFRPGAGMGDVPNRVKALILCNPQNPIGRLWGKKELAQLGEIALGSGITVISDEIHCEILYEGYRHIPFGSISKDFEQNCIVCMAPSKTFNLAGLQASSIIIADRKMRRAFKEARAGIPFPNLFGLTAMEAAYRHGDEWLAQLLPYLQKNLEFTLDYFVRRIPRVTPIKPQATYLLWLDCRKLGLDDMTLRHFMRTNARGGGTTASFSAQAGPAFSV
jgi:cystathionine beta-lyase